MLHFLDFEASSLGKGSFPIEVAFAADDGSERSWLIKPTTAWLARKAWSPASETVHGLPLARLQAEGMPAEQVAAELHALIARPGVRLLSDNPAYEAYWLGQLMEAAGKDTSGLPGLEDVSDAHAEACRPFLNVLTPPGSADRDRRVRLVRESAYMLIQSCTGEVHAKPGTRHRALPDAARMREVWREVRDRAPAAAASLSARLDGR